MNCSQFNDSSNYAVKLPVSAQTGGLCFCRVVGFSISEQFPCLWALFMCSKAQ